MAKIDERRRREGKTDYSKRINITWEGKDVEKIFQASPTPISLAAANKGSVGSSAINLDFY